MWERIRTARRDPGGITLNRRMTLGEELTVRGLDPGHLDVYALPGPEDLLPRADLVVRLGPFQEKKLDATKTGNRVRILLPATILKSLTVALQLDEPTTAESFYIYAISKDTGARYSGQGTRIAAPKGGTMLGASIQLVPGSYWILVHNGHDTPAGESMVGTRELLVDYKTFRVTVSLQEAVVGHGVLVDATGQPVANKWISLQNAAWQPRQDVGSWFHRINTDDQGRFSISGLVAGMQLVSADGKHRFTVPNSPGARVELITK